MTVTVDLYKELELDRAWDESAIRNRLKELNKFWTRRQSACNDKEQLMEIDKMFDLIESALAKLTKASKRKQYDTALDEAYQNGTIKDRVEEKLRSALELAMVYYRKGNIKLATQQAKEAVDGQINDPAAYDLLARCYYDVDKNEQALAVVDQGLGIFEDNLKLHWLGARIATHGVQNYDDAQRRINALLEKAPDSAIAHSEQIYLHLRKGEEELAFQEIDTYIAAHPDDNVFKQGVAYDLNAHSNSCFEYDSATDAYFIKSDEACDKCLNLRTKAESIFSDEVTRKELEDAKKLSEKQWNDWNTDSVKSLAIYGGLLTILYMPVGLILLVIDAVLAFNSYIPYWRIYKAYVTGDPGPLVSTIGTFGDYAAKFGKVFFKFIWWIYKLIFKFIWWMFKFIMRG